jgi:hypothetical protein
MPLRKAETRSYTAKYKDKLLKLKLHCLFVNKRKHRAKINIQFSENQRRKRHIFLHVQMKSHLGAYLQIVRYTRMCWVKKNTSCNLDEC